MVYVIYTIVSNRHILVGVKNEKYFIVWYSSNGHYSECLSQCHYRSVIGPAGQHIK